MDTLLDIVLALLVIGPVAYVFGYIVVHSLEISQGLRIIIGG